MSNPGMASSPVSSQLDIFTKSVMPWSTCTPKRRRLFTGATMNVAKTCKKKHEEWNRVCPPWTTLNHSLAVYVLAAGTSSPKTFCWTKISTLNLLTLDGRTSWRMSPTGWSLLCFPHLFLSFLVAVAWVKLRQIAQFLGKAINPFRPLSINDINACPSHVWIVWGPVLW